MEKIIQEFKSGWAQFADYLPQLLAAILLIAIAYVVARCVMWLLTKGVESLKFLNTEDDKGKSAAQSVGKAGFWLTILFFLPAILTKLGLPQTVGSVQGMIDGILIYTPRIFGAALFLGVGWLVASIVRTAIESLLNAAPIDAAAEKAGFADTVKGSAIASATGMIVFILIMLPVVIGALDTLAIDAVSGPMTAMLENVLVTIPNIFVAAIILLAAFLIGRLVKGFLLSILPALGFDRVWQSLGFATSAEAMDNIDDAKQQKAPVEGAVSASAVVANIVMVAIIFFGIIEAVAALNFVSVSLILNKLVAIVGRILMGAIVILAGIYMARFVANLLRQGSGDKSNIVATIAQYGIIVLVTAMGLREMGLGEDIIMVGFTLVLAAAALAAGLAFGIGGKETAHKVLEDLRNRK
jgi:hypothetical protein